MNDMKGDVWMRDEVESPCVKLCVMHPAEGLCMGCYRTLAEIGGWSGMSPEARRAVMSELPARAPRVAGARRGGHEGRVRRRDQ